MKNNPLIKAFIVILSFSILFFLACFEDNEDSMVGQILLGLALEANNPHYVAVGRTTSGANIWYSTDGITWDSNNSITGLNAYYYDLAHHDGRVIVVGRQGTEIGASQYSDDGGRNWTGVSTGLNTLGYYLNDVAFGPSLGQVYAVAVGTNGSLIMSMLNGENWNILSNPIYHSDISLNGVTCGDDRFVAVGDKPASGGDAVILRSDSWASNWISVTSPTTSDLNAVYYGNGRYVAVGDSGTIYYSDNGTSWTAATSNTATNINLYDVTYGNGIWTTVGQYGNVRFSNNNGETWINRNGASPTTTDLVSVAYAPSDELHNDPKFIAVGKSIIIYSIDSMDWTIATDSSVLGVNNYLNGITYRQ